MGKGRPKKEKVDVVSFADGDEIVEITNTIEITEDNIDDESSEIQEAVQQIIAPRRESNNIIEFCPTGSDLFDLIGGNGVPWGKMINIVGDNSTGKTLLASEIIATAYKKYGKNLVWFYDDAEAGYSFDSKAIWGIDIVAEDSKCSETLEDFQCTLDKMLDKLKSEQKFIYILDSFDSLTTLEELDHVDKKNKAIEKGTKIPGSYGQSKSKGSSEFFRVMRRKLKDKNCLLIIVSQVRENIGVMFGAKYARMGGKALDFYSAQIFWLAVAEKYDDGISVKIKNTKNKVGKPFRVTLVDIIFDYGVDNVSSNLNFLYDLKTPTGKNIDAIKTKKLMWDKREYTQKHLVRYIEKNNLEEELTKRTIQKWIENEDKINTSKDRKSKF